MKNTFLALALSLSLFPLCGFAREFGGSGIGGGFNSTTYLKLDEVRFELNDVLDYAKNAQRSNDYKTAVLILEEGLLKAQDKLQSNKKTKNSFSSYLVTQELEYLSVIGMRDLLKRGDLREILDLLTIIKFQYRILDEVIQTYDKKFYIRAIEEGADHLSRQNKLLLEKSLSINLYQVINFSHTFIHEIYFETYISKAQKQRYLDGYVFWLREYQRLNPKNNRLSRLIKKIEVEKDITKNLSYMQEFFEISFEIIESNPEKSNLVNDLVI